MRFVNDDFPIRQELSDSVAEEHSKHFIAVAEEQIKAIHHHKDGSAVELHEVSSKEFIAQLISSSLEGKLAGGSSFDEIEYEKKSLQNQPQQLYGAQQSVTGAGMQYGQETAMMGCNCGTEWTVTGQSTKADQSNPAAVKIEQYGSASGGATGYNSGAGRVTASGSQQQEYKS